MYPGPKIPPARLCRLWPSSDDGGGDDDDYVDPHDEGPHLMGAVAKRL